MPARSRADLTLPGLGRARPLLARAKPPRRAMPRALHATRGARAGGGTGTLGRPSPAALATALLEACAVAAAVVVPLFFNPRTERVFEPDKLAWLIALAAVALAGLVVRALAEPGGAARALRRPLVRALVVLALALVLGTVMSRAPAISVWGAYRRGHGAIVWLAWMVLAAAASNASRWTTARERLRAALVAPAAPAAAYALLQRLQIDTIPWQQYGDDAAVRAFGPMGNAIFLGAYLAAVAPLAAEGLFRAWRAGERARSAAYAVASALCLAGILASQSRGPALGLLAGLGAFGLLAAVRAGRRRLAMAALVAGIGVPLALVGLGRASAPGLDRFGELLSPASRTVRQRVLAWEGLAEAAKADPARILFGHGPETTSLVLAPHAPAQLRKLVPDQVFDRAHNVLWEWWVAAGLFGVLALVAVYVAAFGTAYHALGWLTSRRHAIALAGTAVGGALAGLLLAAVVTAPLGAAGAALGLAAGLVGWGTWRGLRAPRGAATADGIVLAVLGVLSARLVEGALGLPNAAAELVFWLALALLLGATASRPEAGAPPAGDAAADGLAVGLGLATVAFAPLFLPFGLTAVMRGPNLAILMLPALYWVLMVVLLPMQAPPWRRDATALGLFAGFALTFRLLQGRVGGPTVAFAAVLAAAVAGMALRRARPAQPGERSVRWAVLAGALAAALLAAGWAGLRPVLADAWLRHGLERATLGERAAMRHAFDRASALWPAQPVFALYAAAVRRDEMLAAGSDAAAREAALDAGAAALEGAWRRVRAPEYARQLAMLYRDDGDLAGDAQARQGAWTSATAWFERALGADPYATATLAEHAALFERLGDAAAAAAGYRAALGAGDAAGYRAALDAGRADPALLAALARAELGGEDPTAVPRAAEALEAAWANAGRGGDEAVERFVALVVDPGPTATGPLGDPVPARGRARARAMALAVAGRSSEAREALAALQAGSEAGPVEAALARWLSDGPGNG